MPAHTVGPPQVIGGKHVWMPAQWVGPPQVAPLQTVAAV